MSFGSVSPRAQPGGHVMSWGGTIQGLVPTVWLGRLLSFLFTVYTAVHLAGPGLAASGLGVLKAVTLLLCAYSFHL